ncbi:MAG TPA: helix-turn-helix domain-containing protein [Bauldia sp.]|nr:helix-turn-helix domain-containing protein [Bauldia sp.]
MHSAQPFRVEETHGILTRPENSIRASSDRFGWTSLYASAQREIPYEGMFPAVKDQLIVLHLDGPVQIDRLHGPNAARCLMPAGGIHLVPGGLDFGVRLMGALSTLHVYVRRAIIEEVAAELFDGDPAHIDIPPQFLEPNAAMQSLLGAIRAALAEDAYGTSLYVDYLSRAIAAQLIRHHTGQRVRQISGLAPIGHIGPVVVEAIDYMRAHIAAPISLEDIASAVNRSPSHVARQFRNGLGIPPHQYLLVLRIKEAQRMLATTSVPIAEIAFACGFSHQEHLTRMFRRWCSTTPATFRKASRN